MSGSGPDGPLLSGFDGFLMKPFRMEDVAAALEHAGRVSHVAKVQPARKRRKSASSAASPVDAPGTAIPSPKRVIPSRSSVLSAPLFPASSTASLPTSSRLTDSSRAASNSRMDVLSQPRTDLSKETQGVPSAVPLLDERIYEQLADSMPVTQLHQMYALCLKDARERVTSMRRLVSQQDQVQFVRQAHTIKGGCGMLGASELYAIATRLEAAGVQAPGLRDTPDVNPLDELSSACDRLERMLDARALASNLSGTDQPEQ
jgi:HPt (histidine-containing phosphotransfer) domain-containing protein